MSLSLDHLTCPLCKQLASDAVESSCCHQIFCESCSDDISVCSRCQKRVIFSDSELARRLIACALLSCKHCTKKFKKDQLPKHEENCELRPRCCKGANCSFVTGDRLEGFKHLTTELGDELWANFETLSKASMLLFIYTL